jgi:uncharacterized membrane protein
VSRGDNKMNLLGIIFVIIGVVFLVKPRFLYYFNLGTYGQITKAGLKKGAVVSENKTLAFNLLGILMVIIGMLIYGGI